MSHFTELSKIKTPISDFMVLFYYYLVIPDIIMFETIVWKNVETPRMTMNMRVQMYNDRLAQLFSNQLLDIVNGKIELDQNTQCIKVPKNVCSVVDLIVFPGHARNSAT